MRFAVRTSKACCVTHASPASDVSSQRRTVSRSMLAQAFTRLVTTALLCLVHSARHGAQSAVPLQSLHAPSQYASLFGLPQRPSWSTLATEDAAMLAMVLVMQVRASSELNA